MFIFLLVILLGTARSRLPQSVPKSRKSDYSEWDSSSNWRIYKPMEFQRVFGIPADSLKYLEFHSLNDDSIRSMTQSAHRLNVQSGAAWMGCYLASCKNSKGELLKLVISQYGGFFYCVKDSSYYELPLSIRPDWLTYFSRSYMTFQNPANN